MWLRNIPIKLKKRGGIMELFSSSENLKKFITTLIREKVSLYKIDDFNDFLIEKATR